MAQICASKAMVLGVDLSGGRYGYKIIVITSDNQYFAIFSDKKAKPNKLVLNSSYTR